MAPAKTESKLVRVEPKNEGLVRRFEASIKSGKGSYHIAGLDFFGAQSMEVDEETADLLRNTEAFNLAERLYKSEEAA